MNFFNFKCYFTKIDFRLISLSIIISILAPFKISISADWSTFNIDNSPLPSNNVLSIAIDEVGTKWFGTDNGLVHYDGENWKVFLTESHENLTDNFVNDIEFQIIDDQSILWIATNKGVSLINITDPESPSFQSPYRPDNSPLVDSVVRVITVDPGNVKWFGTLSGLSRLYQNDWDSYSTENFWIDNDNVISLASGPDSTVYIGTAGGGVSRLKYNNIDGITSASSLNTTWTGFYEPDSGKLTSDNIYSILIEDNGRQWFGTDDGIALHTSYNTLRDWKNYTTQDGLINNFVQAICKESDDIFWFGTSEGISKFDGVSWTNFTLEDGLVGNNVRDIEIDQEGSLWIATESGISILKNNTTDIDSNERLMENDEIKLKNYPNPFNLSTSIHFSLINDANVKIDIYNNIGQHITTLRNSQLVAGSHSIIWNGKNFSGNTVPSGVYFIQLSMDDKIKTHKILAIK